MLVTALIQQLCQQQQLTVEAAGVLAGQIDSQAPIAWLIQQQCVDGDSLARALATLLSMDVIDLDQIDDASIDLKLLPEKIIREHQLLPIAVNEKFIALVIADPCRPALLQEIQLVVDKPIVWQLVAYDKLAKRIAQLLHLQAQHDLADDVTVVHYVQKLFIDAINKQASDIHIESYAKQLRIRFRIDGILYEIAQLSQHLAPRLIAHLKVLAQLDITERRLPQDGRLQINLPQQKSVDCRLSICPTAHGEKCVLRLLNTATVDLAMDTLGFNADQQSQFLHAIQKPQGLILVTGPTGSGKTVTLYTALRYLNQPHVNISSAEDPIEIDLPGINQVHINPKIDLTFANVLRAFLRQDPDIIMIGEMRDKETAEIAIQAAQTGHLVLSTLHTNSAVETLTRLINMGIPAYQIAATVTLIIAQRLVRCLCVDCKSPDPLVSLSPQFTSYTAVGCSKCQSGYLGRTAIYEVLPMTAQLAEIILQQPDKHLLAQTAQAHGMQLLYENGLQKVKLGVTSMAELTRVIC